MVTVERVLIRHENEAQLLSKALAGDASSIHAVLQYLCAKDPDQRQVMQQTMHDLMDANLCMHLTSCLATQRWAGRRDGPRTSECFDEAILSVMTTDEYVWEGAIKVSVLHAAMQRSDTRMRLATICILGMRGEVQMIPALAAAIEDAKIIWKPRLIRALGALNDARCLPALLGALALDRGAYHTDVVKALRSMGYLAEPAWQEMMSHPDSHIRWHAACGLGELGDGRGASLLADALFDEDSNVRWASVEVLTHLGTDGIPAMLHALSRHPDLNPGRQAIFQALKGAAFNSPQEQRRLRPLMECLHKPDTCKEAPAIAGRILRE